MLDREGKGQSYAYDHGIIVSLPYTERACISVAQKLGRSTMDLQSVC